MPETFYQICPNCPSNYCVYRGVFNWCLNCGAQLQPWGWKIEVTKYEK